VSLRRKHLGYLVLTIILLAFGCHKDSAIDARVEKRVEYKVYKTGSIGQPGGGGQVDYELELYPNPFIDSTAIYLTLDGTGEVAVQLTDKQGAFFSEFRETLKAGDYRIALQFSGFERGILLCEIIVADAVERYQLVKEEK